VLRRNDFEGASVQDVVHEAGMSSRSFYEFFRSKDDLVMELVQRATAAFMQRIAAAFDGPRQPADVVDHLLLAYLEELVPVLTLDRERIGRSVGERIEVHRTFYFEKLLDLVLARLHTAVEDGQISTVPERVVIEVVLTGIEGLTLRYNRENRLAELAELRPALGRALLDLVGAGKSAHT